MARLEDMARTRPVGTVRGDRSVLVILRDEYLTSQVCPTCHQRTMENVVGTRRGGEVGELWSVLRCTNANCGEFGAFHGRNLVGARNISRVHLHGIDGRPDGLRRPGAQA